MKTLERNKVWSSVNLLAAAFFREDLMPLQLLVLGLVALAAFAYFGVWLEGLSELGVAKA